MLCKINQCIPFRKKFISINFNGFFVFAFVLFSLSSYANSTFLKKSSLSILDNDACPIVLFIEPLSTICIDTSAGPIPLMVTIQGSDGSGFGVWSGPGIVDPILGIFDPLDPAVVLGENIVTYTFTENSCVIDENTILTLQNAPDADFTLDTPICLNEFSSIEAIKTNAQNYSWDFDSGTINSGTMGGPLEISWTDPGSYTIQLKITDDLGCSASKTHQIEVIKPLDVPEITCNGTTSELFFGWNDIPEATDLEVTLINGPPGVESPFLYSFSNLMAGGDSVTIQVSAIGPLPCGNSVATKTCYTNACPPLGINILPVDDICLYPGTQQVDLVGTLENFDLPGLWAGNGIIDPVNGIFDPNHQAVQNGENKLFITFADDNCIYKDSITIKVFDIPTVDAGLPTEINCTNTEVPLFGNSSAVNLNYNWNGPSIVAGNNSSTALVDYPGTYYLTVIDSVSSCINKDSVLVTIDPNVPIASAGIDKAITCAVNATVLEGGGSIGSNFKYIWHGPGINLENANDQHPEVKIPGNYVLQVQEISNNCYSLKDSVFVEDKTASPLTEINQQIDNINCEIVSNELIGNTIQNGNYEWLNSSFQPIGNGFSFTAPNQGLYYYHVEDLATGCVGIDSIEVTENVPYPLTSIHVTDAIDCDTKEILLDGSGSTSGQNIIYSWTRADGSIVNNQSGPFATVDQAGNYSLTVRDTLINCSSQDFSNVIEVFNAPIAVIDDIGEVSCNALSTELDGSGSRGIESLNFRWIFDRNVVGQEAIVAVENAGTYALIVSNKNSNCHDTAIVNLKYDFPPIENVGIDITPPSCFGENDGILVFDSIIGGNPTYTFSIDGGQNFTNYNQFYTIEAGPIEFVLEDANGCKWDTLLNVLQPTNLDLSIGDDLVLRMGDSLNLTASFNIDNSLVDTIIWYPSDILFCSSSENCTSVSARPLNSFYARATLIDLNGCIEQDKIRVELDKEQIAFVPNIFSPNGDNKNDKFTIYASNSVKEIKHFSVYNRWGKTIYEGTNITPNDPTFGWDGTMNGKPLNPGVFVYWAEVELIDGQKTIFKGEVTLIK